MNRHRRLLLRVLSTVAVAALIVGGLLATGRFLRDDLRTRERYQLSIHEIECELPTGENRKDFLTEVHYYGQLPEKLSTLDENLHQKLLEAFAKHPKVAKVQRVIITGPNHVRVDMQFH